MFRFLVPLVCLLFCSPALAQQPRTYGDDGYVPKSYGSPADSPQTVPGTGSVSYDGWRPSARQYISKNTSISPNGVLMFTSAYCGPCQQMKPLVQEYITQFISLDDSDGRAIAQQFRVNSIPTFVAMRDGKEIGRCSGLQEKQTIALMAERAGAPNTPKPSNYGSGSSDYYRVNNHDRKATTVRVLSGGGSAGSGVVVGSKGGKALVLTNDHVVNDGFRSRQPVYRGPYVVVMSDGTRYPARLFDHNPTFDIAALIIEPGHDIPYAPLADHNEPSKGAPITLCGYGGGEWREVSGTVLGYVKSRDYSETELAVTAISIPGDSGGPIYDSNNHVVGILWGGPVAGPPVFGFGQRPRMIHTQAIRPKTIDGWINERTGALAEIFGPHSSVPRAEGDIKALQARIAQLERQLAQCYPQQTPPQTLPPSTVTPIADVGLRAEVESLRSELANLRIELARARGDIDRNTQLANTARELHEKWSPLYPDVAELVRNGLAPERQAILDAARAESKAIFEREKQEQDRLIAERQRLIDEALQAHEAQLRDMYDKSQKQLKDVVATTEELKSKTDAVESVAKTAKMTAENATSTSTSTLEKVLAIKDSVDIGLSTMKDRIDAGDTKVIAMLEGVQSAAENAKQESILKATQVAEAALREREAGGNWKSILTAVVGVLTGGAGLAGWAASRAKAKVADVLLSKVGSIVAKDK